MFLKNFYKADWCEYGVRPECKQCNKANRSKNYIKARILDPNIRKNVVLKSKYGISIEIFNKMLVEQNFKCKICNTTNPGVVAFAVDHCHKTNKVRGLLCQGCNLGLGGFRDNTDSLKQAILYLEAFDG